MGSRGRAANGGGSNLLVLLLRPSGSGGHVHVLLSGTLPSATMTRQLVV